VVVAAEELSDQQATPTRPSRLLLAATKPVPFDAPFESLADLTAEWADVVDQRWEELRPAWDRAVVVEGATLLRELAALPKGVLLHQDFHLDAARIRDWVHARAVGWALWDLTVGEPAASDETFHGASIAARARRGRRSLEHPAL